MSWEREGCVGKRIELDIVQCIAANGTSAAPGRTCGGCTVCCTTLAVPEIAKPEDVPCEFLFGRGCGVYECRPEECRLYLCMWMLGLGGPDDRPEKSGLLFALTDDGIAQADTSLTVYELRPRALTQRFASMDDLLRWIPNSPRYVVTIYPYGVLKASCEPGGARYPGVTVAYGYQQRYAVRGPVRVNTGCVLPDGSIAQTMAEYEAWLRKGAGDGGQTRGEGCNRV